MTPHWHPGLTEPCVHDDQWPDDQWRVRDILEVAANVVVLLALIAVVVAVAWVMGG